MGHGRALINIDDPDIQLNIYEKILTEKLSVRDAEALVRNYKSPNQVKSTKRNKLPSYAKEAKQDLSIALDSNVSFKISDTGSGQFTVPFKSKQDLQRILKLIKSEK